MRIPAPWYKHYINTQHWKSWRRLTKRSADNACQECGGHGQLTCHHLTYERIGEEIKEDLVVLCCGCHILAHRYCEPDMMDVIYKPDPPSKVAEILHRERHYYA